jgi:hypothetical protein
LGGAVDMHQFSVGYRPCHFALTRFPCIPPKEQRLIHNSRSNSQIPIPQEDIHTFLQPVKTEHTISIHSFPSNSHHLLPSDEKKKRERFVDGVLEDEKRVQHHVGTAPMILDDEMTL